MLWPALQALSLGKLSEDQQAWLREKLGLTDGPRTDGPGAADSLAHRRLADSDGVGLVLDLARMDDDAWLFTLFKTSGDNPSAAFVEAQRAVFRAAIDHLGLQLVEIQPPATADEVFVPRADPEEAAASAFDAVWTLPDELDKLWWHLGLLDDAPREVKQVKLRALMAAPVWHEAPARVRQEAREFLDGR